MCGLPSDLVICKFRKCMVIHAWHRMSSLRPGVIKQHKSNTTIPPATIPPPLPMHIWMWMTLNSLFADSNVSIHYLLSNTDCVRSGRVCTNQTCIFVNFWSKVSCICLSIYLSNAHKLTSETRIKSPWLNTLPFAWYLINICIFKIHNVVWNLLRWTTRSIWTYWDQTVLEIVTYWSLCFIGIHKQYLDIS